LLETIDYNKRPKVVITATGMLTGGRILSYLNTSVYLRLINYVGYQAEGQRKRLLEELKRSRFMGNIIPLKIF
jgi:metallo-beta-lactamase family protein